MFRLVIIRNSGRVSFMGNFNSQPEVDEVILIECMAEDPVKIAKWRDLDSGKDFNERFIEEDKKEKE